MSETPSVEERLAYLEDQNNALKRAGGLLVCLVIVMGVAMIFSSRSLSSAVNTDGLIINNLGKLRAALTSMPNGHLGMLFFDFNGNLPQEVQYNAIPYLDGVAFYDRDGHPRILIGMDDKNNPILAVVSAEGKTLFSALTPMENPAEAEATPDSKANPSDSPTPRATPTP